MHMNMAAPGHLNMCRSQHREQNRIRQWRPPEGSNEDSPRTLKNHWDCLRSISSSHGVPARFSGQPAKNGRTSACSFSGGCSKTSVGW